MQWQLKDGDLCRVAKRDNIDGCGAKGHLRKNADGSWTLVSMYKINEDVSFQEKDIAWMTNFFDDEHGRHYRIQL